MISPFYVGQEVVCTKSKWVYKKGEVLVIRKVKNSDSFGPGVCWFEGRGSTGLLWPHIEPTEECNLEDFI